ncbi:MAG: EF-P beta-lysylation protein EpmB [Gammaproteobacteria bacterium]
MIPRTSASWQSAAWQGELTQAINNPAELLALLDLAPDLLPAALASAQDFSLRVPRGYVARMQKRDPHDPLLRQVLPIGEEQLNAPGFSFDAVGDLAAMPVPGVLHKYHGRVLLVTTGACAIHCRFCFRRHFPYAAANPGTQQWDAAIEYIRADTGIREVILSGGDPLSLTDQRLSALASRLEKIPHLKYLRIHTRLPIVLPERVDADLLNWLTGTRLKPVMVLHANHANEIDESVRVALAALAAHGVTLFNQSVLLRGVNDSAAVLASLSEVLFDAGVTPYYLHLLDRVKGTGHFEVSEARACQIMDQLRTVLPGYLVPRLVREEQGARSKQAIFSAST